MALQELQNGRYHYLRLLGVGGMGEVFLMQDERVTRQVAIKVIRSENASALDSTAAANAARLFQREAKAIAALEHPNILPLYDFGEEISEGTTLSYMVMPFCADGSLATWLRQHVGNSLSPQDIAYIIEQAAEGLQYAHDHDVIHLDVKPSNFLLRGNKKNPNHPTLLLADFGIARSSTTVSNTSRTIRGTPTAMGPEQWTSSPVPATDQYALAVMTYEMLTGRPPFVGSMEQLMYQHFSTPPPAPSTFNTTLPAAVDPVLVRALAKKPEDRFPSIAAFASALQDAVHGVPAEISHEPQSPGIETYATVAISKEEAGTGISRMITLPGGGKVNVPIPAGTQDGQLIRVPSSSESSDQSNALVLSIAVKPTEGVLRPDEAIDVVPQQPITPQLFEPVSGHDLPTMAASPSIQTAERDAVVQKKSSPFRFGTVSIVSLLVLLLLVGSSIFYFSTSRGNRQLGASAINNPNVGATHTAATTQRPTPTATLGVTPTPTPANGMYIPGTYKGSMFNETTNQTTAITVFLVQTKGSGALQGSVTYSSAPQTPYSLTGKVDMQGKFYFSIQQAAGQKPLLYYGTVQQQGGNFLKGNFCNSTTNTCLSLLGYFNVGPGY